MNFKNFGLINQQALEFLNERAEPETALELLKQALPRRSFNKGNIEIPNLAHHPHLPQTSSSSDEMSN
jgi:hypothetical protein